jgi:hypothetical protein
LYLFIIKIEDNQKTIDQGLRTTKAVTKFAYSRSEVIQMGSVQGRKKEGFPEK